ncbi:MAG TPA: mannonate dehydratase [Gemmatimonadaceae bacterium]|nr:mannonate dehydratase [Gemmatimonadaceae bacterium]
MELTFRWYGERDAIPLEHIRQIPGVTGVVSALHDVPPGIEWPLGALTRLGERIERAGLRLAVVESIPVHEDVKLGRPERDRWIDAWCRTLEHVGALGVPVVCYNFMPVFDWTRTDLAYPLPDGSTALAYDDAALARIDLSQGTGALPGWAAAYDADELRALLAAYADVDAERMWEHLAYFLARVAPVAERVGVRLALHPDDPPWPVFGLPRIVTDGPALERVLSLVESPASGLCFCTGSLGASPANDLPALARALAARGRVHFVHARNVRVTGVRSFHESPHPSALGSVDLYAVLHALVGAGFRGPVRPDHGRMIWGETGRPGYGLHDRALGATYLYGLWEGISRGPSHHPRSTPTRGSRS